MAFEVAPSATERESRFTAAYLDSVERLVLEVARLLVAKSKLDLDLCSSTNVNVAHFPVECFSTMDRGFVISDHADWDGLNTAIQSTGAERIFVTHGYTGPFRRWLQDKGYNAEIVSTDYHGEAAEDAE